MNAPHKPAPPASLFATRTIDLGEVPGVGHVIVHEAVAGNVWDVLDKARTDPQAFARKMLAASLEVDGYRFTATDLDRLPFSKFRALQDLLPKVLEVNAIAQGEGEAASPARSGKDDGPGD